MIGNVLGKEEVGAALVIALSGTVMALVAKGEGPFSVRRILAGVLSNPVPERRVRGVGGGEPAPALRTRIAA